MLSTYPSIYTSKWSSLGERSPLIPADSAIKLNSLKLDENIFAQSAEKTLLT